MNFKITCHKCKKVENKFKNKKFEDALIGYLEEGWTYDIIKDENRCFCPKCSKIEIDQSHLVYVFPESQNIH